MSVSRPRNRLIYFRVSEDEYQKYNHACASTGSRSISELARSAMESIVQHSDKHEDRLTERLSVIETLVSDLNRKVHELSVSISRAVASNAGERENRANAGLGME